MSASRTRHGVLLVAHGSRDRQGTGEFLGVADGLARRMTDPVQPCFLELAEPTIDMGLCQLVDDGVCRVTVLPLVLLAAGHAKLDIPRTVGAAAGKFSPLDVGQASHLGFHEYLLDLSATRYLELTGSHDPIPADQTLLLMVGRGTSDPTALAELRQFVRLRARRTPVGGVKTCFLAMAEPLLERALTEAAGSTFRRVVVQPHLLFHGELLLKLREQVEQIARRYPDKQWLLTAHLGPHPLLLDAMVDLIAMHAEMNDAC